MSSEERCNYCEALLGEKSVLSIGTGKAYCGDSCAYEGHAGPTVEAWRVGRAVKDERALTIPDIYLAEFVGVLRRALNKGGLTDRLDDMLDSWCDDQEAYLEEKYPTEKKQGACPISLHFVTKPCESAVFQGLDSFVRTGYHDPEAPEHTTANIAEELLSSVCPGSATMHEQDLERIREMQRERRMQNLDMRLGEWATERLEIDTPEKAEDMARQLFEVTRQAAENIVRQYPPAVAPEMEGEAWDRMQPFRRRFPTAFPSLRRDKSGITTILSINGIDGSGYSTRAIEPEEPRLESLEWSDSRAPVAPCSCRQFQGDSLECPQHGAGSAWYDLHGGE